MTLSLTICFEVILEKKQWEAPIIFTHGSGLAEGNMRGTAASPLLCIHQAK